MSGNPIEHSFSRRALFVGAGTVFTSFAIPLVAGQRVPEPLQVLLPTVAYADDAEFEFDIASASQVGLKVVDVNTSDKTAVKNAKIVVTAVTKHDFKKDETFTVTVTTDETGTAVVDLRDLGTEATKSATPYIRTADIKIYAAGCRLIYLPSVELIGKTAMALPTCSVASGDRRRGYFQSVTFNDNDVQYFDASFLYSVANDARHTIKARAIARDADWCTVSIWRWRNAGEVFPGFTSKDLVQLNSKEFTIDGNKVAELQKLDEADEKAMAEGRDFDVDAYENRWLHELSLQERFLQKNSKLCFKKGDRLVVRIETPYDDSSYLMNVSFENAPISEAGSQTYDSLPGLVNGSGIQIPLPKSIPVVGGRSSFSIWTPTLPFLCEFSPTGHLLLGYSWSTVNELDTDTGKNPFKKDNWKEKEVEKFKAQCKAYQKEVKEHLSDYKKLNEARAQESGLSKLAKAEAFGGLEFTTAAQLFALFDYDWGESWTGSLNALVGVSLEGEVGAQASILGIPAFIALDATADARLNLRFAAIGNWPSDNIDVGAKILKMFKNMNIKWTDTQVAIVLGVEIGLTVGVGIRGVASISARGSASMTNYIGLFDASLIGTSGEAEDLFWPHYRFGCGADFSLAVQAWIFKYSIKIAEISAPDLYDSWGDRPSTAALDDDDDKIQTTKTGLPDEYKLSGTRAAELGDDDTVTVDDDGNYVISLEELAKNGRVATDAELEKSCEFSASSRARSADLGDEEVDPLEVTLIPAGEAGDVELYAFNIGKADAADEDADASGDTDEAAIAAETGSDDATVDNSGADANSNADQDADASDSNPLGAAAAAVAALGTDSASDAAGTQGEGAEATAAQADDAQTGAAAVAAQADDSNSSEDDTPSGSETDEGEFDIEHIDGHATGAVPGTASIADVTEDGSMKPSVDHKILTGVYSDGRVRLVHLGKDEYLLRIAVGKYNRKIRTRLIAQKRITVGPQKGKWDDPDPVDFKIENLPGISRADLFDYDFEVAEIDSSHIAITLLSGLRPNGEKTDLLTACTQPVTSVIVLTPSIFLDFRACFATSWRSFDQGQKLSKSADDRYLTFSPSISTCWTVTETMPTKKSIFIAGSYLYKRAGKDEILKDETPTHATGFIVRIVDFDGRYSSGGMWNLEYPGTASTLTGVHLAMHSMECDTADKYETAEFIVAYETPARCELRMQRIDNRYYADKGAWECTVTFTDKGALEGCKKIVPWTKGTLPLAAVDKDNVLCGISTYGDTPALIPLVPYKKTDDGSGNEVIVPFVPASFAFSNDGKLLLYVENKEGIDGFNYSETKPTEETYCEGRYRVMACRFIDFGNFVKGTGVTLATKPFVLCEIDHPVDDIASAVISSDASATLITSNITSLENSQSDYYEIRVPVIACLVAKSFGALGRAIFPGETVDMEVTLKNLGNSQASGAKLRLIDTSTGAQVGSDIEVAFNAETIASSSEAQPNPKGDTEPPIYESGYHNELRNASGLAYDDAAFQAHPLVASDGRNFLKPNREATVKFSVTIPEDWSGKKRLRIEACDVQFANPASQSAKVAWAGAAGIIASCVEDSDARNADSGIASIAEIGEEAMESATKPFLEDTTADIELGERVDGDLSRVALPQLLTKGGEVDPGNSGDDNGGSGGGSGSGSSSNGKKGKGALPDTGDRSNFAGMGILGAVALAAGTGLAAYNRRREQVAAEAAVDDAEDATDQDA